jgi:hypothetical protein
MTLQHQLQQKLEQLIKERDAAQAIVDRANGAIEALVWTIQELQGRLTKPMDDEQAEAEGNGN